MKKTLNIHLNGIAFQVEEDGYERLKEYLDSLKSYFAAFEDHEEIIEDIEGRIAEIFLSHLSKAKQVITIHHVEVVMKKIGTPEDFKESIESEESDDPKTDKDEKKPRSERKLGRDKKRKILGGVAAGIASYFKIDPVWIRLILLVCFFNILVFGLSGVVLLAYIILWIALPSSDDKHTGEIKKLFRSKEGKILGGVASGLGKYLGLDTSLIRILFIISIFLGGSGIIIYILMWMIAPEAKTLSDKVKMDGKPFTLSNIKENIKKEFDGVNKSNNILDKFFEIIGSIFDFILKFLEPVLKFLFQIIKIVIGVGFALAGLCSIFVLIMLLLATIGVSSAVNGWLIYDIFPFLSVSLGAFTLISLYTVVFLPLIFVFMVGLSILFRKQLIGVVLGWSMLGIWILGLLGIFITLPSIIFEYKEEGSIRVEKTYKIERSAITLGLKESEETIPFDLDLVDLTLVGHQDSVALLQIKFTSHGSSRSIARKNAESIQYDVSYQDGKMLFADNLSLIDDKFRFQEVDATLFLPYGQMFTMEKDLKLLLKNTLNRRDYFSYQMEGNIWTMEYKGIKCITCDEDK